MFTPLSTSSASPSPALFASHCLALILSTADWTFLAVSSSKLDNAVLYLSLDVLANSAHTRAVVPVKPLVFVIDFNISFCVVGSIWLKAVAKSVNDLFAKLDHAVVICGVIFCVVVTVAKIFACVSGSTCDIPFKKLSAELLAISFHFCSIIGVHLSIVVLCANIVAFVVLSILL